VTVSAAEGTTITIGRDVMFASGNQVRADDGHPIFNVRTGKRVNWSRDITIGPHVWVGANVAILAGSEIGEGSVVALGAVVRGRFPNNCIIGGVPARILRRDIAWERPHTSLREPFYKPDASTVRRSRYWHLTARPPSLVRRARRLVGRVVRRLGRAVR
jgi:acetyltransferase-like isoleucine patch superfamily enzyme